MDLTHNWLNDLGIWVGHNDIWVQLSNQHCGDKDDIYVLFDDEATEHINDNIPSSIPPAVGPGSFKSTSISSLDYFNLLSTFDGMSLEGDWQVWIKEASGLGYGTKTLNIFRIEGTAVSNPAVPEPDTLFLLGSSLIGLATVARKKIFKK